jgi:radical SAM protein with 4Fe4S-binding SPASM domain
MITNRNNDLSNEITLPVVELTEEFLLQNEFAILQCDCDCACSIESRRIIHSLPAPIAYYLELTPYCPNACPGCGNVFAKRQQPDKFPPHLSLKKWSTIINAISPSATILKLTGGEPTLHRDFFDLVGLIDTFAIPYNILTTGRWNNAKRLIDTLSKSRFFRGFLVSLHGPNAITHEYFTHAKGSFDEATSSIKLASNSRFQIAVNMVLTRWNINKILQTVEFALESGAQQVVIGRYIGLDALGIAPKPFELRMAMTEIAALQKRGYPLRYGNCIPQCFEPSSSHGCTAGETFVTIDPWGNLRPCNHSPLIVGNLLDQSINDLWTSPILQAWRSYLPNGCAECSKVPQCYGGCKAITYASRGGDPLMNNHFRNKELKAIPAKLNLSSYARPVKTYRQIDIVETNHVLAGNGRIVSLNDLDYEFIEHVGNGSLSLGQIRDIHGKRALALVGYMYVNGLLSLQSGAFRI